MRWCLFLLLALAGCSPGIDNSDIDMGAKDIEVGDMQLKTGAFDYGKEIPLRYTCQGEDINPELNFIDVPESVQTLALIMEDPDAPGGTWDHWIVFNILPTSGIDEGSVPKGALQGKNSWGRDDYGGPCPPTGTHRYFFRLYALDTVIDLPTGATKADLQKSMKGHILAQAELMGTYRKS